MTTIADFLRARYDEKEAAAKAAQESAPGDQELAQQAGPCVDEAGYAHIALNGPARVLREVEAGRKILADYDDALEHDRDLPEGVHDSRDQWEVERDVAVLDALEAVVLAIAAIDSGHPDYGPAWATP